MTNKSRNFIGIDVGKKKLDLARWGDSSSWQADNTEEGIEELLEWLQSIPNCLVVAEASGGLEMKAVKAISLRALPERTRSGSRRGAGQSHQFHNHPTITPPGCCAKIAGYVK